MTRRVGHSRPQQRLLPVAAPADSDHNHWISVELPGDSPRLQPGLLTSLRQRLGRFLAIQAKESPVMSQALGGGSESCDPARRAGWSRGPGTRPTAWVRSRRHSSWWRATKTSAAIGPLRSPGVSGNWSSSGSSVGTHRTSFLPTPPDTRATPFQRRRRETIRRSAHQGCIAERLYDPLGSKKNANYRICTRHSEKAKLF